MGPACHILLRRDGVHGALMSWGMGVSRWTSDGDGDRTHARLSDSETGEIQRSQQNGY